MIIGVDQNSLSKIKNPAFRAYAGRYIDIYEDFLGQIAQIGLDIDSISNVKTVEVKVDRLRMKGAVVRNDDKSIYINSISPSCIACQKGVGSATYFISLNCHRNCFYCFNPNQENYTYFTSHERDVCAELVAQSKDGQKLKHIALTGGEPLLHEEKCIDFFRTAKQYFPLAYTRLYTCGDSATEEILQTLAGAGLDEIRFSIRMHDLQKGHRHVFDRLALAKEHIPYVMVEMPVLPGTIEEMKAVLLELERLEIFSINLLEFCYPFTNTDVFKQRGYQVKNPPNRVLYNYWYAGGLPITLSELECLDLVEFAIDKNLQIGVHYCSLENKQTGQIYQQNHGQSIPETSYFSQKDYFLKSAKVFGEDISPTLEIFKKKKYNRYSLNHEHNFLEFHVGKIKLLKAIDVEIGISTSVIEEREGEKVVRELKVDLTTPTSFDISSDV
jgi:uncharacterized protein